MKKEIENLKKKMEILNKEEESYRNLQDDTVKEIKNYIKSLIDMKTEKSERMLVAGVVAKEIGRTDRYIYNMLMGAMTTARPKHYFSIAETIQKLVEKKKLNFKDGKLSVNKVRK